MSSAGDGSPADAEAIVARITRQLAAEADAAGLSAEQLDHCVRDAVGALADSRLRTFVHVFVLRRVRACIKAGGTLRGDGEEPTS